jgi:hypothetical protein
MNQRFCAQKTADDGIIPSTAFCLLAARGLEPQMSGNRKENQDEENDDEHIHFSYLL